MGERKPQTIATEKLMKKNNLIIKSYKLKKQVVDEFTEACVAAGQTQSAAITMLMQEYTKKYKK